MRATLTVLLMLVSPQASPTANLEGVWDGALSVSGTKLRMVLDVRRVDGAWSAILASPDQGVSNIQVNEVRIETGVAEPVLETITRWLLNLR